MTGRSPASALRRPLRWIPVPSLVDLFFVMVLAAAFLRPNGWQQLLADGDTGWHIRTGQIVLATGHPPTVDAFSFTRQGQPWFAWEWGAEVVFAFCYNHGGLLAVAKFAGLVLCLAGALLFAWLLRRGSGLWIALAVTLAVVSASTIHYLARPHVFSILFYTVSLWILDEARAGRPRLLWALPPLCAVWANLHAGFVILPVTLAAAAGLEMLVRRWREMRRYAIVALGCAAASLANPFGWKLHQHIVRYLGSSWILDHVQEFQSPSIRSESMVVFAILLLAGAALASLAISQGRTFEGALVLAWGFAAMRSARHIPFLAIAAAPVLAAGMARAWSRAASSQSGGSPVRILWELGADLGRSRITAWLPALGALVVLAAPASRLEFPEAAFPVRAVEENSPEIAPLGRMPRILTSDQWADYLIYKLYPRQRVFFDGRSDFFGPTLGADYTALETAAENWPAAMARYRFDVLLLPRSWPLNAALRREPGWRCIYRDAVAVLYRKSERDGGTLQ